MPDEKSVNKQKALYEKEKGNLAFKNGQFAKAVQIYSTAIKYDDMQPVLYCNRAIAQLKLNKFCEAKKDCDSALTLDPTYTKAYYRRGLASLAFNDMDGALRDFESVLKFEPENKEAKKEVEKLNKLLSDHPEKCLRVHPIEKPVNQTKPPAPLTRVKVTEKRSLRHSESSSISKCQQQQSSPSFPTNKTTNRRQPQVQQSAGPGDQSTTKNSSLPRPDDVIVRPASPTADSAAENEKSTTSSSSFVRSVPKSAFQFLSGWRSMKNDPKIFCAYLLKIPIEQYDNVVDSCLEPELITDILTAYRDYGFVQRNEDEDPTDFTASATSVWNSLQTLSRLKNFNTCKLFFDEKDVEKLDEIINRLKTTKNMNEADLDDLKKRFV